MYKKFCIIFATIIVSIFFTTSFATDFLNSIPNTNGNNNVVIPGQENGMEDNAIMENGETPEQTEEMVSEPIMETPAEEMMEEGEAMPAEITPTETMPTETMPAEEPQIIIQDFSKKEAVNQETQKPTENQKSSNIIPMPNESEVSEEEVEQEITNQMQEEVEAQIGELPATEKEKEVEDILALEESFTREVTDEEIEKILERLEKSKVINKIEALRLSDIIGDEEVSAELKFKIQEVINAAQSEVETYKAIIKDNYKVMTRKLMEVKKELNKVQDFRDEAEYDLEVSKWMILTLSMGVVCLTFLIVIMWRSVTNVSKNEIEVLFAYEDLKKNMTKLNEQIELLYKKNKLKEEKEETGLAEAGLEEVSPETETTKSE